MPAYITSNLKDRKRIAAQLAIINRLTYLWHITKDRAISYLIVYELSTLPLILPRGDEYYVYYK